MGKGHMVACLRVGCARRHIDIEGSWAQEVNRPDSIAVAANRGTER